MTNLQKLMGNEDELIHCLMCPYIPGEPGAGCKDEIEQDNAEFNAKCKPCLKAWLHAEAKE